MLSPYFHALVVSLAVSLAAVPWVLRFATARGLLDPITDRKTHDVPIPRLGGVGILIGFLAGVAAALLLTDAGRDLLRPDRQPWLMVGLLGGGLVMFLVGLMDDLLHDQATGREGLPAPVKLALQVAAAAWAVYHGVRIEGLALLGDEYLRFDPVVSWLLTILWILIITNAINFLDGLDGLAGGISLIMAATIAVIGVRYDYRPREAVMALALIGGLVGFLRLNFPPARIYMGDGGAMLLGFMLSSLVVSGVMKGTTLFAIGGPLLILALPIVNLAQVTVGRILRGQNPMTADRTHIHDRLQDAGWSTYSAVLFIYAITGLCASAALAVSGRPRESAALSLSVAALLVALASRRSQAHVVEEEEGELLDSPPPPTN